MAGGVFAGVLGPQLVQWTMDIWPPYLFAFSFVVQAVVALIAMAVLSGVDAPKPAPADLHGGRPLLEIARQPRFIAAAICGVVVLSDDESGDDLGAAGDADVRAAASAIPISASSGTSWRCTGRASSPAR